MNQEHSAFHSRRHCSRFPAQFPAYAATETKPKKEPSAAQMATRERMTKCSGEWKDAKAGGKVEAG